MFINIFAKRFRYFVGYKYKIEIAKNRKNINKIGENV